MNPEPTLQGRTAQLFAEHSDTLHRRTDRLFAALLAFEFVAGIEAARWVAPGTWLAGQGQLLAAVLLGGLFAGAPIVLAMRRPGSAVTRHAMAAGQAAMCALLVHICGGRTETHFLAIGSLAFLGCYRDWRVLLTATSILGADLLVRGSLWPQSIFGTVEGNGWRTIEHSAWLVFTSIFLLRSIFLDRAQLRMDMQREAHLEVDLRAADEARALAEAERDVLAERQLRSRNLQAVGQLTAGIAHEIGTPPQASEDKGHVLQESFRDLARLLEKADGMARSVRQGTASPEGADELRKAFAAVDMDHLASEIPSSVGITRAGIEHVAKIILAMREFSHADDEGVHPLDLNQAIESAITVATGEWKQVAEVEVDLDPNLPEIPCHPGEVSQVLLNLVVNAAHGISRNTRSGSRASGTIKVSTRLDGDSAEVRVSDSCANPAAFTTDPAAADEPNRDPSSLDVNLDQIRSVVVDRHGGTLTVEVIEGLGTTLVMRLPFKPTVADSTPAAA